MPKYLKGDRHTFYITNQDAVLYPVYREKSCAGRPGNAGTAHGEYAGMELKLPLIRERICLRHLSADSILKEVQVSEDEKTELRLKRMGFVFQQMNMLENFNMIDNVVLPVVHADRKHKREHYERAMDFMEGFHIGDLAGRKVNEVSGGQLQRACICRSMMLEPEILFADEPTGALNQTAAAEVIDAFQKINENGTTILMVTHDSRITAMCERILYILDGEIKGELKLGKNIQKQSRAREQKTVSWLDSMGW